MPFDQSQLTQYSKPIIDTLGDNIKWRWEPRLSAMLSEFARDKKEDKLQILQRVFEHEWNSKTIKKSPKILQEQLGDFCKLSKEQYIFTSPATETQPALVALWWPWGHGGTFSVRLIALEQSYTFSELPVKTSFFERVKLLFS